MLRLIPIFILLCLFSFLGCSREPTQQSTAKGKQKNLTDVQAAVVDQTVEVSCGQCQLGLQGEGCDLAVRIDGKSYYVDGSNIDDHGDAHGDDGLCNCIRTAKVSGEIKDGRFVATSIKVLPNKVSSDQRK